MAGALGPIAACNVGDSQQGPPIVSGPAMQSYWRLGISVTQKRSIIGDPPSGLAKKHLKMLKSIKPQWRNGLNRSLTPQGDMDSSAKVDGNLPINATAFGAQVGKCFGSWSSQRCE